MCEITAPDNGWKALATLVLDAIRASDNSAHSQKSDPAEIGIYPCTPGSIVGTEGSIIFTSYLIHKGQSDALVNA